MQKTKTSKTSQSLKGKSKEAIFAQDIVAEVKADFLSRQKQRFYLERQWELNMNFLSGDQYSFINRLGDIERANKDYAWQERGVFNHIAPIMETRIAKLSRIEPTVYVRPKSDDDKDLAGANSAEKMLSSAFNRLNISSIVKKATDWSEVCGTSFYKVVWDNQGGNKVGELEGAPVFEGEIDVIPVSPFEIFPDSLFNEEIEDCQSIIHARAMTALEVKEKYGIEVVGDDVDVFSLSNRANTMAKAKTTLNNAVVVIERYEKPSIEFPQGRLITVGGDKLLYYGELPYTNGEEKTRRFPFVKQTSIGQVGSFFGQSIIERLIPVQRSFNAVKNRKHEFMNRLLAGVLTVEDGSIDVEDLAEDGLAPGKVIVYRQGSTPPEVMGQSTMPDDFDKEEERLINEFVIISGVSDVTSSSSNASLSSGSALEILINQDNERLLTSAENVRKCYLEISRQAIRLYGQFFAKMRAVRYIDDDNKTKVYYADKFAIRSDDVYLNNENELLTSPEKKKETILKLYTSGLLADEKGEVRPETKEKVLTLLGYKDLDYQKGVAKLQEEKAQKENEKLRKTSVDIDEIDDDVIHIDEHTRYMLSEYDELTAEIKQRFNEHIYNHKLRKNENQKNKEKGE